MEIEESLVDSHVGIGIRTKATTSWQSSGNPFQQDRSRRPWTAAGNPGRRDVSLANTGAEGEKATYYISHVIVRLEDKWRMEDRDLKVVSSRSTSRFESCVVGKRKGGKWILPGIEFTSILARIEARTVRSSRERDDRAVRFVGGNLTTCPIDRFV